MAGSATVTIGGQRLPGLPFFCARGETGIFRKTRKVYQRVGR
jgi:hypothetical protein